VVVEVELSQTLQLLQDKVEQVVADQVVQTLHQEGLLIQVVVAEADQVQELVVLAELVVLVLL
tara:strand:+ start:356 stop:544 length:189 start_codon:yes stop_codon:yes gene_type:complete